ncbi:hypothetical protein NUSPORA_01766 [Nucleospora cyclopteri]
MVIKKKKITSKEQKTSKKTLKNDGKLEKEEYWLSDEIIPCDYNCYFRVYENFYTGKINITCKSKSMDKKDVLLKLNSKGLEISKVINSKSGEELQYELRNELLLINHELIETVFHIDIEFKNNFTDGALDGFYRSKWNDTYIFTTKFEPNFARKAFPCFDQPNMKATFEITVECDQKYTALSNSSVKSVQKLNNGRKIVNFHKTPLMSTYIVAWAVGELVKISKNVISIFSGQEEKYKKDLFVGDDNQVQLNNGSFEINLYAHKDEIEWGRFSLEIAENCLKFFENYFDFPYVLPKVDLLGFPAFAGGAMENWGLIMFRKTSLLFNPEATFSSYKLSIANTLCHELAHMWFGNLVTMNWWDDLWLNEGFATWAASKVLHEMKLEIFSGINFWGHFSSTSFQSCMFDDSLPSTHPVAATVRDPAEIGSIFDSISYTKGSVVIRMIENLMGAENFRNGLRNYIKTFKYKNTVTTDLWDHLNNFYIGENSLEEVVGPWINQKGFPIVTVEEENEFLVLTQEKFSLTRLENKKIEKNTWPIPIEIDWFNGIKENLIFKEKTVRIEKQGALYKFNKNGVGFYRVFYKNDQIVTNLLSLNTLSVEDRISLYNDCYGLCMAGYLDFDLSIYQNVSTDDDYTILLTVIGVLLSMKSLFYDSDEKLEKINILLKSIVENKVKTIDLTRIPENNLLCDVLKASIIVSTAQKIDLLEFESKDVHFEFKRAYFSSLSDKNQEYLKDFYENSKAPGQKEFALYGLTQCRNPDNFNSLIKDLSFVAQQDSLYLFRGMSDNFYLRDLITSFFIDNFDYIQNSIIKRKSSLMRYCIKAVFSVPVKKKMIKKIESFSKIIKKDKELFCAIENALNKAKFATLIKEKYNNKSI